MNNSLAPQHANRLVGHDLSAAVAEPAPIVETSENWIAIDHPDRLIAQPATMGSVFVRIDPSHELPIVVAVQVGQQLQVRARFALPGDCSMTFSRDPKTLPEAIMRQLAGR